MAAVGEWHSRAHVLRCLRTYSIVRAVGSASYDGEGEERINAYLRQGATAMRDCTKANYLLKLDTMCKTICRRKWSNASKLLRDRHDHLMRKATKLQRELSTACTLLPSGYAIKRLRDLHTTSRASLQPETVLKGQTATVVDPDTKYRQDLADYMDLLLRYHAHRQA